jgi:hypothetical protein
VKQLPPVKAEHITIEGTCEVRNTRDGCKALVFTTAFGMHALQLGYKLNPAEAKALAIELAKPSIEVHTSIPPQPQHTR